MARLTHKNTLSSSNTLSPVTSYSDNGNITAGSTPHTHTHTPNTAHGNEELTYQHLAAMARGVVNEIVCFWAALVS